jgi:hypothetical protein
MQYLREDIASLFVGFVSFCSKSLCLAKCPNSSRPRDSRGSSPERIKPGHHLEIEERGTVSVGCDRVRVANRF